jgi:putative inorganic carbon (HCO3(-)) transporter
LNPLTLPIIGLGVAYLIATAASVNLQLSIWGPGDNPHGIVTLLCCLAFVLLIAGVLRTKEELDGFVNALLLGSVPVALYGILQYLGLDLLPWIANPISPTFSTMGNANFLGAYLAMVIPFTLLRIVLAENSDRRFRFILVLLLQVTCLGLTLGRGAWLGMMGGTLAFLTILAWRWRRRIMLVAAVGALLIGVIVFIQINTTILQPLSLSASPLSKVNRSPAKIETTSMQARMIVWTDTLQLLADRWWLGYGPATFVHIFAERYPFALADLEGPDVWVTDPHNFFLVLLVDAGIVGLAAFLWIMITFGRLVCTVFAHTVDQATQATLAAITGSVIAFLIQAQFNPTIIVLSALFWLNLALGVGMAKSAGVVS